jgi:histone H3/H4
MAKKEAKKEVPMLLTQSKVKEFAKGEADVNVGGDFMDALNAEVADTIGRAIKRCSDNGRKTLRAQDV